MFCFFKTKLLFQNQVADTVCSPKFVASADASGRIVVWNPLSSYIWCASLWLLFSHAAPSFILQCRFESPGPRLVSVFFAAPAFVASASITRHDTIEIFLFASLTPKPILLRDSRANGRVTAFAVDAAGRKILLYRFSCALSIQR